jgi:hypothetical protein
MANQNYGAKSLGLLDNPFITKSKTEVIINKGITLDFNGVNTVTFYTPATVAEVDYVRDGSNRFGALVELPNGIQTKILSQDKAATWTIDRGNYNDSMMAVNAENSMALQVQKVAVPNTDKYRFTTLVAYAVAQSQSSTSATTSTDIYEKFLVEQAALTDAEVPEEGRYAFFPATHANKLKTSPTFKKDCDTSYKDAKTGAIGMVDGTTVIIVPSSYLPANTTFLIVHEETLISPTKMKLARTLDNVQGIDGWVCEYRRYYDAFISTAKGVAIRVHKES